MKKTLSILLVLVMLLGILPMQVQAVDVGNGAIPLPSAYDATAVLGGSTTLEYKLTNVTARNTLIVEIYKGDSEYFMEHENLQPVETRRYDLSDNTYFSFTWTADSRYSVGDYSIIVYRVTSEGRPLIQTIFVVDLHVIAAPRPATDAYLMIAEDNSSYEFSLFDGIFQWRDQNKLMMAFLYPAANTTNRTYTLTNYDTDIFSSAQLGKHGLIQVGGCKIGSTYLTVDFGDFKKEFLIIVEEPTLEIQLPAKGTALCPGQTEALTPSYTAVINGSRTTVSSDSVKPKWYSDNSSVVTVEDGVVTAVGPGTANVTIVAGTITKTISYTVRAHRLPEDAPIEPGTATQPTRQIGKCQICGAENAVNNIAPPVFVDTKADAWYAPHVDYVYEKEIMNGSGTNTFAPDRTMTRAELVTVLYRIAGNPAVEGTLPFTDVEEGTWYSDAILWASQNQIVNGVGNGRFAPAANITREQIATILYRYTQSLSVEMAPGADLTAFPDCDSVAAFAADGLSWAVAEGLITGTASGGVTTLSPQANATRAQLATIISRYMTTEWKPVTPPEELPDELPEEQPEELPEELPEEQPEEQPEEL